MIISKIIKSDGCYEILPLMFMISFFLFVITGLSWSLDFNVWGLCLAFFIVVEILFWLDKQTPGLLDTKFGFTFLKKLECIVETFWILGIVNLLALIINKFELSWFKVIIDILLWLGIGIVCIALFWLFIYLNSLKYSKEKKE